MMMTDLEAALCGTEQAIARFVTEHEAEILFGLRTIGDRELALELVELLKEWRQATQALLEAHS